MSFVTGRVITLVLVLPHSIENCAKDALFADFITIVCVSIEEAKEDIDSFIITSFSFCDRRWSQFAPRPFICCVIEEKLFL